MSAAKLFNVHSPDAYGYVHYAIVNGERVELSRKECPPPLATITAPDLTAALAVARLRFGQSVVVTTPSEIPVTSSSGRAGSPTGAPR